MFRLHAALAICVLFVYSDRCSASQRSAQRPNVILVMTDDQGWADAGYMGHPRLKTPHLDAIARTGVRFERFYAAAPVCSPTRASVLTGRHPYRLGITGANVGHLPAEERTLAEILRERGYCTGHFGKWHLGTLTRTVLDSNRGGPRGAAHYAPPWEHGFDVCFSTEAKTPTFDPMITPTTIAFGGGNGSTPGEPYGTAYWTGPGQRETDNLEGDDSRIIMDRAIPFIEQSVQDDAPFLAVIWFHAPHLPVVAGEVHRAPYTELSEYEQQYFGCITAADEQIGRLRARLRELGVADNTMLWFCSDNGPEGRTGSDPGSAGVLRGRKRSLYEGGVRVPGLLEWPAKITEPRVVTAPCVTSDYLPTLLDLLDIEDANIVEPLDGVSMVPLILGDQVERGRGIGFQSGAQATWVEDRYKLVQRSNDGGVHTEVFDVREDPGEMQVAIDLLPDELQRMIRELEKWKQSCERSARGED